METSIHKTEVLRCLSRRGITLNGETQPALDEGIALMRNAVRPAVLLQRFALFWQGEELFLSRPGVLLPGEEIRRYLAGCGEAAVLAATLGRDADRLISAAGETDPDKACLLSACAAVALEQLCAASERELGIKANAEGKFITLRFLSGCGDFPVQSRKALLSAVDAPCKIGLSAGDDGVFSPAQSVAAVIGISGSPILDSRKNCEMCCLLDRCQYKKDGCHCGE